MASAVALAMASAASAEAALVVDLVVDSALV